MIEENNNALSIRDQCKLLGLHRSNYYYEPVSISGATDELMKAVDGIYNDHPYFGARRMVVALEAMYPKPNMSKHNPLHRVYPYLLKDYKIIRPDEVWSSDITYIRLSHGFIYLVAIIDWYSRYVLAWRISTSLDVDFCVDALLEALGHGHPSIFNTDTDLNLRA
jgi:putative transposase